MASHQTHAIKLYGTGSATANAVANITIPSKGKIIGVQVSMGITSITASSSAKCEISKASAREIATNGAQQCIVEVNLFSNFVTSGLSTAGVNQFFPVSIDVVQGQLIYLHAVVAGTATYDFTAVVFYA